MSHEAFIDFYSNYLDSPAGEKDRARFDGISDRDAFCAAMVEVGAAAGYTFTTSEVMAVMKASEKSAQQALAEAEGDVELTDDALDGVVGGAMSLSSVPVVAIGGGIRIDPGKLGGAGSTAMCPW